MAHIGTFAAARREVNPVAEKDTFDFCGEAFTVEDTIPSMLMIQLGASATGKIEEQEGLGAMWEAMRVSLTVPARTELVDGQEATVPEDGSQFDRFYRLAVAHRVDLEDLMAVAMALFQAQAGRPTEQRPTSPDGSLSTSTSSNTSPSPHPALQGLTPVAQVLAG
ncbi:hypothetical protein [Micromonospora cathayae]|uniref:Uncharacterized protein n=1 Tax=Micromonospora cathayae TaxID=3028804 RepID=A0ABY7ZVV9_9ACTN|nr:hypothetical protein [Micromonospora sp. HUAS 3]WDZ87184.1 hypothetical protein PVK37_12650 [Micromonospora sp. HUAS 3]